MTLTEAAPVRVREEASAGASWPEGLGLCAWYPGHNSPRYVLLGTVGDTGEKGPSGQVNTQAQVGGWVWARQATAPGSQEGKREHGPQVTERSRKQRGSPSAFVSSLEGEGTEGMGGQSATPPGWGGGAPVVSWGVRETQLQGSAPLIETVRQWGQ